MPNMKTVINAHNKKILTPPKIPKKDCNKCPTQNSLRQATILSKSQRTTNLVYYRIAETSFSHRINKSYTEVSNEYWKINDLEKNVNSMREILGRHKTYQ